jgi:hypothetical protein
VISVHILCLDDCLVTTIMPQPTEITQFIFGQPLRVRVLQRYRPLLVPATKASQAAAASNCGFPLNCPTLFS